MLWVRQSHTAAACILDRSSHVRKPLTSTYCFDLVHEDDASIGLCCRATPASITLSHHYCTTNLPLTPHPTLPCDSHLQQPRNEFCHAIAAVGPTTHGLCCIQAAAVTSYVLPRICWEIDCQYMQCVVWSVFRCWVLLCVQLCLTRRMECGCGLRHCQEW